MSRNYEALIVLDSNALEGAVDEMIGKISKEMEEEGVNLGQIDHIGQKKFPSAPQGVTGGYYVNIQFGGEPEVIEKVKDRLRLNTSIYQQYYQRIA
jgi:ribosomal protein S6